MQPDNEQRKLKIDILLNEKNQRFQEYQLHVQRYHNHTLLFQILFSIIIGFLGFILFFFKDSYITSQKIKIVEIINVIKHSNYEIIIFIVILLLSFSCFYMVSTILNSLYLVLCNSFGIALLEKKINSEVEEDLLTWESKISGVLYHNTFLHKNIWIRPNIFVAFCSLVIFISFNSLCYILSCFILSNFYFNIMIGILIVFPLFIIIEWVLLYSVGKKKISESIESLSKKII